MTGAGDAPARRRIVVVDDHEMFRSALCALLQRTPELEVVGEAVDGAAALGLIAELAPDVLVVDLNLPDMSGLELMARLRAGGQTMAAILLTGGGAEDLVEEAQRVGIDRVFAKSDALHKLGDVLATTPAR